MLKTNLGIAAKIGKMNLRAIPSKLLVLWNDLKR